MTGCLAPAGGRGVTVWVVSGDEELTFDTAPSLENQVYSAARAELRLKGAINETVAVQIGLQTAQPPAGPFHIQVTDLLGPAGRLPAAATVFLYRVHYTRVEQLRSWYPRHTGRPATPRLVPDVLVPWDAPRGGGPLLLSETRNEAIWLEVRIPPTADAGEYQGRLELRGGTTLRSVFACDIRLTVLPVALPGRRSLPVICRVDPRDLLAAHLRWPRDTAEETRLLPDLPSHLAAVRLVRETMQLFQEHRTNPILWASFPKFRPAGHGEQHEVYAQWEEYDQLVGPWLDGSGFADRVRLEAWPLPVSLDYPSAERNGGLDSPTYARLLGACLRECQRHFAQRGWLERAFARLVPPAPLSHLSVDEVRRAAEIACPTETGVALVAHLPAASLRGLGWHDAPSIELPGVGIWAPTAMWFEPGMMERERRRGHKTWVMPDAPPFSGSLAVEAPPTDARILPWQAYRYGVEALWVEHAAACGPVTPAATAQQPWAGPGLIYPAEQYGLRDRPLPSLRLKRLLRGLQDYELLRLLEDNGKRLLAQSLAGQVVRWAFTDACQDNLLSCREAGWPSEPTGVCVLQLARDLMLQELAGEFEPNPASRQRQLDSLSSWSLMMTQARHLVATVEGVRLTLADHGLRARVLASIVNATNRPVQGRWTLAAPPVGWQQVGEAYSSLEPGTRRPATIELQMTGLAYNVDGIYPFELAFDTPARGVLRVPARLAVAVCPVVEAAPIIDGQLGDWPLASNNAAGDFRLCRQITPASAAGAETPALPTQAFFGMDRDNLYFGIRCTLIPGQPPVWQADNTIPIDGAQPWGQDVVELLLDPRGPGPAAQTGTSSDLYCLQIKPSGLLVARRGCRTEPPVGSSTLWQSGARVAVKVQHDVWIVELAVPLSAFGPQARRNPVWGCNVTRLDARRGEYSSWSGAREHCYSPASLGNLIMLWR